MQPGNPATALLLRCAAAAELVGRLGPGRLPAAPSCRQPGQRGAAGGQAGARPPLQLVDFLPPSPLAPHNGGRRPPGSQPLGGREWGENCGGRCQAGPAPRRGRPSPLSQQPRQSFVHCLAWQQQHQPRELSLLVLLLHTCTYIIFKHSTNITNVFLRNFLERTSRMFH